MQEVDREGYFRGSISSFGLREIADSGAVCVSLQADVAEHWNGESWDDWREYEMFAKGDLWIIKKDGSLNNSAVQSLLKNANWNGQLGSIVDGSWEPCDVQFQVQSDAYKNQTRYRLSFVNAYDSVPGGGATGNVDAEKLKALDARFGGQLRALAGNVKRNTTSAPSGKPATPARPPKKETVTAGQTPDTPF